MQVLCLTFQDAGGCTNFKPRRSEDDQKVSEFTESEHRTAEYQAECSTDITQQSQYRVRLFRLDVHVLQFRVKHLKQSQIALVVTY